jgi:transcriptional regulator with XRE-family HTH domain
MSQPAGGLDELSRTLRELRNAAGLSGRKAAEQTGFSQAKISRIEGGVNVPTPEDVATLADAYKVPPPTRKRLIELAEDVRADNRRVVFIKPAKFQQRIERIEQASAKIRSFAPTVVPGLLQTETYARALATAGGLSRAELDLWAAARMARQKLLYSSVHKLTVLTTAGALAWRAGTPQDMADQIERIYEATRLPNVTVGVIPWGTEARAFPLHGWDLYDQRAVIVGTMNATAVLTEPRDVQIYADLSDELEAMAVYDQEARNVLHRIELDYRKLTS